MYLYFWAHSDFRWVEQPVYIICAKHILGTKLHKTHLTSSDICVNLCFVHLVFWECSNRDPKKVKSSIKVCPSFLRREQTAFSRKSVQKVRLSIQGPDLAPVYHITTTIPPKGIGVLPNQIEFICTWFGDGVNNSMELLQFLMLFVCS